MSTAVIIGRFQPLHNGHIALINQAVKDNDNVLVLVGSCNKERDFNNPFTVDQRIQMLANVYEGDGFDAPMVRGLKDKPSDDEWVQEVVANVNQVEEDPSKVILYTSEKDSDFYSENFIYNTCVKDSDGINATDIRANLYSPLLRVTIALDNVPKENHALLLGLPSEFYKAFHDEKESCVIGKREAIQSHKFGNPIEPVCHAAVLWRGKILLVKRESIRGKGQWAIPGGFMEREETTRSAALRELKEETGVDLMSLRVKEMAQAVEENIDDLSVRTIGINYLYLVDPTEEIAVDLDTNECSDYQWVESSTLLTEQINLFYNHTVILQRLFSIVGNSQGNS